MPAFLIHFIAIPILEGAKQQPAAIFETSLNPRADAMLAPIMMGVVAPTTAMTMPRLPINFSVVISMSIPASSTSRINLELKKDKVKEGSKRIENVS